MVSKATIPVYIFLLSVMVFCSKLIKAEMEADSTKMMYNEAVQLLRRSKSDLALEKLFHLKEMVKQSDSLSNNIIISIAEGYRQRQEYKKGLELLYELLTKPGISALVKINAWNRIAALYNEGPAFTAKLDSVIKYSNFCIDIAESNGFTEELAVSQNELGYVYSMTSYRDYPKARVLLDAAFKNFRSLGANQNAVNVAINLGSLYVEMNAYSKAHQVIDTAMTLCNEADNKNLFNRVYFLKSQIYAKEKNFRKAYEFMAKSRQLNNDFYNDRLNEQIFEMAAKFETEKKELENLELRKNNEIQALKLSYKNNAIAFLSIGLIISALLLLVIFLFLRRKTIAYRKLVEQNLELAQLDKSGFETDMYILSTKSKITDSLQNETSKDNEIVENFRRYLSTEKPYFSSHISIEEVAAKIGTNRTYLSKAINEVYNKSFNTIINEYRIRAARQIITDKNYAHLSLEAITEMVGYCSRTTFISNFKKFTGLTPSYFRDSIKDSLK